MMDPYVSPRQSPRRCSIRYNSTSCAHRSPSPRRGTEATAVVSDNNKRLSGLRSSNEALINISQSPSTSSMYDGAFSTASHHRRNTLPKHGQQFLSPNDVFNRTGSRSPSRRRQSFKESAPGKSSPRQTDSWESYAASKQASRKMSLPISEPISPSSQTKLVNVVIVGDSNVGKYSLIRHLVDPEGDPNSSLDKSVRVHRLGFSLADNYVEIIFEHHQNVDKIIDVSRDNGYMIRNMEILVVMYSAADRRSFEMSAQYLTMAVFTCRKYNPSLNICLLANKTDLVRAREISTEEGLSLAERFEVSFMEVSVELEDNFDKFVEWLTCCIKDKLKIGEIRRSDLMMTPVSSKNGNLSQKALRFVRKILARRGSKSKSCDNIHAMG